MVLSKLKKIKKKLNKAKAATPTIETEINAAIAPINFLPAEVLGYIFQCLLDSHSPCFVEEGGQEGGKTLRPPDYPDSLLRSKDPPTSQGISETRWSIPLDIHIFDKPRRPWRIYDKPDDEYSNLEVYLMSGLAFGILDEDEFIVRDDPEALEFILSIPTRAPVRSIELAMTPNDMPRLFGPVLRQFFGGCSPGILTKLTSQGEDFLPFIDPRATRSPTHALFPPVDKLEAIWLSITTLHTSGATYLPWSSNAFKGLTDLRLGTSSTISESQFVHILKSSPGLRILQFHLRVTGTSPLNTLVEPIHLKDLEVLDLIEKRLDGPGFETLIRWIDLGHKSLRLSLWCPIGAESLQNFFRRSNVTEFHSRIDGSDDINIAQLETILGLSPGLRVLAIDACDHRFLSRNAIYGTGDSLHSPVRIDTLHLQYCQSIQLDKLHWMIKKYSIQKLMMWSSTVLEGRHTAIERDISSLCPVVKRLKRREFTPMEDWIESIV